MFVFLCAAALVACGGNVVVDPSTGGAPAAASATSSASATTGSASSSSSGESFCDCACHGICEDSCSAGFYGAVTNFCEGTALTGECITCIRLACDAGLQLSMPPSCP
jgi:hypothetical protein